MSRQSFTLRKARDGTVTFRYGRYVESFDAQYLGAYDLYERLRFAALTAGLGLSAETLERLYREVRGLAP